MEEKGMQVQFASPVSLTGIDEDGLYFSDGSKIGDQHSQSWCEYVYADWKSVETEIHTRDGITGMVFAGVEGSGMRIATLYENGTVEMAFLPCYNEQNGYYSDNLELYYTTNNGE